MGTIRYILSLTDITITKLNIAEFGILTIQFNSANELPTLLFTLFPHFVTSAAAIVYGNRFYFVYTVKCARIHCMQ